MGKFSSDSLASTECSFAELPSDLRAARNAMKNSIYWLPRDRTEVKSITSWLIPEARRMISTSQTDRDRAHDGVGIQRKVDCHRGLQSEREIICTGIAAGPLAGRAISFPCPPTPDSSGNGTQVLDAPQSGFCLDCDTSRRSYCDGKSEAPFDPLPKCCGFNGVASSGKISDDA